MAPGKINQNEKGKEKGVEAIVLESNAHRVIVARSSTLLKQGVVGVRFARPPLLTHID